jgi:hypothetical protein
MKGYHWIYPAFGMLMGLMFVYFALTKKTRENFYGMSPGTLTQLQSSHVPNTLFVLPTSLAHHRFKPFASFGEENSALEQTPMPYLIY